MSKPIKENFQDGDYRPQAHLPRYLEQAWWEHFKAEVFKGMLHTDPRWNKVCKNLWVSTLVLIHYDGKSKSGDWQWGQILHAEPDPDGLVQTVLVKYTIPGRPGSSRMIKEIKVAVQRLVLIYS